MEPTEEQLKNRLVGAGIPTPITSEVLRASVAPTIATPLTVTPPNIQNLPLADIQTSQAQPSNDFVKSLEDIESKLAAFDIEEGISAKTATEQKELLEANKRIQLLQAKALEAEKEAEARAIPFPIIGSEVTKIRKEEAIKAIELSAFAQAAQDNLLLARDLAKRAVKAEFADLKEEARVQRANIVSNYDKFTPEQKRRADDTLRRLDAQDAFLKEKEKEREDIQKIALDLVSKGGSLADADRVRKSNDVIEAQVLATEAMPKPIFKEERVVGGISSLSTAILANPRLYLDLPAGEKAKIIPELQAQGFAFPRELNPTQQTAQQNAQSALLALSILEGKIFNADGTLNRKALVTAATGFGGTAAARREIIDVISRIRTGAALTESEQAFYAKQAPNIRDDKKTAQQKMTQLTALFAGIAGSPIVLKSPNGELLKYDDMFDSNQRNEVRKLLSQNYTIAEF